MMTEIARFFGIRILMYYDEHNPPHFHAIYADNEASFNLSGELLNGHIPARYKKYIEVWADIHRQELEENWEKARNNEELTSIKGLN